MVMSEVALVGQGHRAGRHAEECAEIEVREQARKLVPRSGWMRSVGTIVGWDVRRYGNFLKFIELFIFTCAWCVLGI